MGEMVVKNTLRTMSFPRQRASSAASSVAHAWPAPAPLLPRPRAPPRRPPLLRRLPAAPPPEAAPRPGGPGAPAPGAPVAADPAPSASRRRRPGPSSTPPAAPPPPPPVAPSAGAPVECSGSLPSARAALRAGGPADPGAAPHTVSFGVTGADASNTPADEEKKQSRFYFTRFTWGNAVQASTVGVGQSFISATPTYDMTFTLNARYYFVNEPRDKAYVNVNLGFAVEVTDSPDTTTTTQHQPLFQDMVVGAGYGHAVYKSADHQWNTTLGLGASFTLPTSGCRARARANTSPPASPASSPRRSRSPAPRPTGSPTCSPSAPWAIFTCSPGASPRLLNAVAGLPTRQAGPANLADANSSATVVLPETSADDQLARRIAGVRPRRSSTSPIT